MKPHVLAVTVGLDVVTPESSLPEGAVRVADNVMLGNDGSVEQREGFAAHIALPDAHSFWKSPAQTRVLAAARDKLYQVDLQTAAAAAIFTGLLTDQPVSYQDVGPDIYFCSLGTLRKIAADGTIRRPGIADLLGTTPTLTQTVGGLYAGRYGVAYSLINDLGEESPISSIAWIDLTTGGILLSSIQTATDVVSMRIYVTAQNGGALHHHATRAYSATTTITDQTLRKEATRSGLLPMPGGSIVRLYNGRLYVVDRKTVWVSEPLDYGVYHAERGWMTFNRTITMFEPVAGGIFIGMHERTLFLRGDHQSFTQVPVAARGAFPRSSDKAPADYFAPNLVPNRSEPVAGWLSEVGLAIGRADGSVAYPQAQRLRLDGGEARILFAQRGGIKQAIFCVDGMTIGTGSDRTI